MDQPEAAIHKIMVLQHSWCVTLAAAFVPGPRALSSEAGTLYPGPHASLSDETFRTLQKVVRYEEVIKKSRFVALAAPVDSASEADEFVKEHSDPKARHNCFAWRLANGDTRTNGDGEPGGTAGPPILAAITGADLHGIAVLVSRYRLGEGAKLGTGGLVRAYGGTAAQCLALGELRHIEQRVAAIARFAAEDTGAVFAILGGYSPQTAVLPTSPPETMARFEVPSSDVERLSEELTSATNGRVSCFLAEGAGVDSGEDEWDDEWDDDDFVEYDESQ